MENAGMKYELDSGRWYHKNNHYQNIAILTGLPYSEIIPACPKKEIWHGQDFVKVFQKLGFNTTQRFEKFRQDCDKPMLMRTTSFQKGFWYAWVYYDHVVYLGDNATMTFDDWQKAWKRLKPTSMLPVWI